VLVPADDYARRIEELLPLLDRCVRFVARRMGLSADEAEDLAGAARLKLIEDDYAVLRRFQGKSRLDTFLHMVVRNLAIDRQREKEGKRVSSAEAKRRGGWAIKYEALRVGGLGADEARQRLLQEGLAPDRKELEAFEARLVVRGPRRFDGEEALKRQACPGLNPEEALLEQERLKIGSRARVLLGRALGELAPDDRMALRLFFEQGIGARQIARVLGWKSDKRVYHRIEQLCRGLRVALKAAGLTDQEIRQLLADEWPKGGP